MDTCYKMETYSKAIEKAEAERKKTEARFEEAQKAVGTMGKIGAAYVEYEKLKEQGKHEEAKAIVKHADEEYREASKDDEAASIYVRALRVNAAKLAARKILEELAAMKKLDGVPVCFKKFQSELERLEEKYNADVWCCSDSFDAQASAHVEHETYHFYFASFCRKEDEGFDARPVFDNEKAMSCASMIRPAAPKTLRSLAYSWRKERDRQQAELEKLESKLDSRAEKYDCLGLNDCYWRTITKFYTR